MVRYSAESGDSAWYCRAMRVWCGSMGHNKGKDNVKKRAVRRKKAEATAAKSKAKAAA